MTLYNNDTEIIDLIERFETRSLPKSEWTHAAHLTVALFYCTSHPIGTARNLMRDGIIWLNDSHGTENSDTSGYHETLTWFWMDVVHEFILGRRKGEPLYMMANALVNALSSDLPLHVYSRELLFSVAARSYYIAPDLIGPKTNDEPAADCDDHTSSLDGHAKAHTTAEDAPTQVQ